jgi:hypothetical protein
MSDIGYFYCGVILGTALTSLITSAIWDITKVRPLEHLLCQENIMLLKDIDSNGKVVTKCLDKYKND